MSWAVRRVGLVDDETEAWLLDSDPALAWQVERDLFDLPEKTWTATRGRVPVEGFGARLLALQGDDGMWGGGAYFPTDFDFQGGEAQPWTATTWSLNALREWGVEGEALGDTADRLAANARWDYDNLPYWAGEVDCCINGYTIANGAWLGVEVEDLVGWFDEHRMADGGWNCDWVEGATRSSFPSTLNSLKGLLQYEVLSGISTQAIRRPGEEYLLERGLFRRRSTGEPVAPWVFDVEYPFRWFYNLINATDYFREAALVDGTPPDPRMEEAMEHVRGSRHDDGTWHQQLRHPGRVWFHVDVPPGEPSKWLTLHARRVLDWWDQGQTIT